MAQLPKCPNWREKRCERSDLVLMGEDERYYRFFCRTCSLFWVWSKDKQRSEARELARVKKLQELSERERNRIAVFYAPKGGWAR